MTALDPAAAFLQAAVWHGSIDAPEEILRAHPEIANASIHTAAVLGDDASVRRWLALDPACVGAKAGPGGWDPLTFLCFSKYLRMDRARTPGFIRAAEALLAGGASANTGFREPNHQPAPEWESALYGAAGVAHHPELTRLLLEHGADPNDEETPYHSPEGYDNAALRVLVESGKLTPDSITIMLLRKADWHDLEGIRYLLEQGADPNRATRWHITALQQAMRRDNRIEIVEAMLDHGADPTLVGPGGQSALSIAIRRGRADVLALLERRGIRMAFAGVEGAIADCARGQAPSSDRETTAQVLAEGGPRLAEFAGNGNREGVGCLLDLGVPVDAPYEGDLYWGVAAGSTALHVAAWRARHTTVKLLLDRGAAVDAPDAKGRTPLMMAVLACVDSYWSEHRSTESIEALLMAGASAAAVPLPSGYPQADQLLQAAQSQAGCKPDPAH